MEVVTLANLVEIKDIILKFLESKHFLKDVEQLCSFYLKSDPKTKEKVPLIFTIKINYDEIPRKGNFFFIKRISSLISMFFLDLLNLIALETENFLEILEEVVHFLVKTYLEQTTNKISDILSSEIICNFQFFDLPLQLYKFSLRSAHINCSLSTFRCVVQRIDPVVKYM